MKKYAAKATNFANPLVFYRISDTMNLFKANIFERLGESGLLMFESSNSQHVCFYKESLVGLGNPSGLSRVYPRICDVIKSLDIFVEPCRKHIKYAAKATNFANPLVFCRISDTMNLFKANTFGHLGEEQAADVRMRQPATCVFL